MPFVISMACSFCWTLVVIRSTYTKASRPLLLVTTSRFFYKKCLVYAEAHKPKLYSGFFKMLDSTDIAVRDVHDIIGCVAHFYEKGKSGNTKEVQMKEEKTKEVQTERK